MSGLDIARVGRRAQLAAAVSSVFSMLMIMASVALVAAGISPDGSAGPGYAQPSPSGRGDPVLANQLADQARGLTGRDPLGQLRRLLAAHVVDPDSVAHRLALTEFLLGPRPVASAAIVVGPATAVDFSDDAHLLAVGGRGGVQLATLTDATTLTVEAPKADTVADVTGLRFTADSTQIVTATGKGLTPVNTPVTTNPRELLPAALSGLHAVVRLGEHGWAATTRDGRLLYWWEQLSPPPVLAEHLGEQAPLAATGDGRRLFARTPDGGVAVWTHEPTGPHQGAVLPADGVVTSLAVSGDGRLLLVGGATTATVWDLTQPGSAGPVATLDPGSGSLHQVAISPDGNTAVTATAGGAMVWDLSRPTAPTRVAELPGEVTAVAYTPDGSRLATAGVDHIDVWSLTELLTLRPAEVAPTLTTQASLGLDEPVTYAAMSTAAGHTLVSTAHSAQLWQTGWIGDTPEIRLVKTIDTPIGGASAAGELMRSTLVTLDPTGVTAWTVVYPGIAIRNGPLGGPADTVAVSPDGNTAITVTGTDGTVWDVGPLGPTATGTLSYPQPTTALGFAAAGNTLIAGHPDGSITVHAINPTNTDATKRTLTGHSGPINAVTVATNASVALGVDQAGTLSVWDLTSRADDPASTTTGASGAGPHRAWISADGGFAILTDAAATPTLWSLVDPTHPYRLARLPQGGAPAIPAMVSADGHTMISIDRAGTLRVWNLSPVGRSRQRPDQPGLPARQPRPRDLAPDSCPTPPSPTPACHRRYRRSTIRRPIPTKTGRNARASWGSPSRYKLPQRGMTGRSHGAHDAPYWRATAGMTGRQ